MPVASRHFPNLVKTPLDALDAVLHIGAYEALAQKQAAEAELAEAQKVVSPADYPVPELRGDAVKLWDSIDHEVILSGPAETGKTYTALHKLNMLMWKYPGAQAAIVRKTYQSMHGTVLQTYRRILGRDTPVHAYGGEKPEWFDYPNGSRVFIGGMDNSQKVLSSERDIIYVNQAEELELDDHETLTTRCTGRGGVMPFAQIFGDCNPGPANHWILQRPTVRLLNSRHEDNPTLYDRAGNQTEQGKRTMAILDALTGTRYKRLRLGLWVGAEGMVYETWDRSVHVVNRADLVQWGVLTPEGRFNRSVIRDVYGGQDWGFTNPGVLHVWGRDSDGRVYLVHEVYRSQQLIDWWIEQARAAQDFYGFSRMFCDPSEPAYIEQMRRAGLPAEEAQNAVAPGIQAVQNRLPTQPDGRPRLYVLGDALSERDPLLDAHKKPSGFIEEVDGYVWQKATAGRPQKEEPVKENDHGCDTVRYVIYSIDNKRPPGKPVTGAVRQAAPTPPGFR